MSLTFNVTLVMLRYDASPILLIGRPFVDIHGCVGGACIQDNAILGQEKLVKPSGGQRNQITLSSSEMTCTCKCGCTGVQ